MGIKPGLKDQTGSLVDQSMYWTSEKSDS